VASISPLSRMDDMTKHHLYIAPSIGKLHVMIQLLMNHYIIRKLFFWQNFDFKIYILLYFPFYSKENSHILEEMFWENNHHPWTQILVFG
jgi:hypothetical protein